ncbi:MAG: hypothetical protein DRO18_00270 [Thermoprotei archaeon]|nr:MAG: hypothetical protein DRO18_00270 [Thermoprotei archaeon]
MMFTTSRIESFSERLIEFVAKVASGIKYDKAKLALITGPTLLQLVIDVINAVSTAVSLRSPNGLLYCGLCRKGPFTKRGMYLHLIRIHRYELKTLIMSELEEHIKKL